MVNIISNYIFISLFLYEEGIFIIKVEFCGKKWCTVENCGRLFTRPVYISTYKQALRKCEKGLLPERRFECGWIGEGQRV